MAGDTVARSVSVGRTELISPRSDLEPRLATGNLLSTVPFCNNAAPSSIPTCLEETGIQNKPALTKLPCLEGNP